MVPAPHDAQLDRTFRALADPTRRAILDRLRDGPLAVNPLAADFAQTRPAISKHLRVLREAQLVDERKVGRERVYHLEAEQLADATDWLERYRQFWGQSLHNLKIWLEEQPPK